MDTNILRATALGRGALLLLTLCFVTALATPNLNAKPKEDSIDVIPVIENVIVQNGQLIASGTASVTRNGKTTTVPFTAPLTLSLSTNQPGGGAACPVLDLALGPINLDLLGLVVQTSPICLNIN